ncbi:MAG TPA: hypothetical protein VFU15_00130 [Bacteroidia bacterium]|nr:hypothetical protein [Bacteroidia bacterium]
MSEPAAFPAYRKYKNGLSFFRINSVSSFDEIRKVGSRFLFSHHEVVIFPDRNLLNDLLSAYHDFALEITREEWEDALERVEIKPE